MGKQPAIALAPSTPMFWDAFSSNTFNNQCQVDKVCVRHRRGREERGTRPGPRFAISVVTITLLPRVQFRGAVRIFLQPLSLTTSSNKAQVRERNGGSSFFSSFAIHVASWSPSYELSSVPAHYVAIDTDPMCYVYCPSALYCSRSLSCALSPRTHLNRQFSSEF